jgi:hypothetical protein
MNASSPGNDTMPPGPDNDIYQRARPLICTNPTIGRNPLAAALGILWSTRRKHWTKLPYFIKRVSVAEGLLLLEFAQELPEPGDRITSWDRLRIVVNAGVYPSRWRSLSHWHEVKLRQLHPELRLALDVPGQVLA